MADETQDPYLVRTQDGRRAVWERGGGYSRTGDAVIVAGADGEPLSAAYVRRGGDLACREHALIPVTDGAFVVALTRRGENHTVQIRRVVGDVTIPVAEYRDGAWCIGDAAPIYGYVDGRAILCTHGLPLGDALAAAADKAATYHCRRPVYVL